jgi:uncharacterized protein YegP (UPF0339 family)
MKAYIKKSRSLTQKFFYVLKGKNGEKLAHSETFVAKQSAVKVLKKYFPGFEIIDETK